MVLLALITVLLVALVAGVVHFIPKGGAQGGVSVNDTELVALFDPERCRNIAYALGDGGGAASLHASWHERLGLFSVKLHTHTQSRHIPRHEASGSSLTDAIDRLEAQLAAYRHGMFVIAEPWGLDQGPMQNRDYDPRRGENAWKVTCFDQVAHGPTVEACLDSIADDMSDLNRSRGYWYWKANSGRHHPALPV